MVGVAKEGCEKRFKVCIGNDVSGVSHRGRGCQPAIMGESTAVQSNTLPSAKKLDPVIQGISPPSANVSTRGGMQTSSEICDFVELE
jgi:hypothetical protein